MLISAEGADQHDQGAFGEMEIGDEPINAAEFAARIQEDIRITAASADLAVFFGHGFQGAAAGGTHADDTMPLGFGLADQLGSLLADAVPLGVHHVIGDVFLFYRPEGAQPHMQGDLGNADAKTPQKWSDYFSGQDFMAEFKTANDNMGDFTYMPGFSAVGAAMKQTAAKAADGSAKVSDVFDTAQKTSVDTLKNLGLSVKE